MDILIENNPQDKNKLISLLSKSFNDVVKNYEKNINDEFLDWLVGKLNIMLKKAFKGDLYAQKNVKIKGELAAKTYDIVISSYTYRRVLLVIDVNKNTDNKMSSFLRTFKDNLFYTMNLAINKIPYYNLNLVSLENVTPEGKIEKFSLKNLIRVYNGNKHNNIIPGVNKIILMKGNVSSGNFKIIGNINEIYNTSEKVKNGINENVLLDDVKYFFVDIYNILQRYL